MSQHRTNIESEINNLLARRWSPRAFDARQDVDENTIDICIEAARWAPSCFGDEPWRFLICRRSQNETAWQQLLDCLAPANRQWASSAPVLILVCADSLFGYDEKPNRWSQYDTGAAAMSLCLQASAAGLITRQIGGFDAEATSKTFAIPERFTPMSIIAVGYEGDHASLHENHQSNETASRSRKQMQEIAFVSVWGSFRY